MSLFALVEFGFKLEQRILQRGAQQIFVDGRDVIPFGLKQAVDDIVNRHLAILKKRNCNFLLNCAPNRDGLMDENVVQRLAEVGSVYKN